MKKISQPSQEERERAYQEYLRVTQPTKTSPISLPEILNRFKSEEDLEEELLSLSSEDKKDLEILIKRLYFALKNKDLNKFLDLFEQIRHFLMQFKHEDLFDSINPEIIEIILDPEQNETYSSFLDEIKNKTYDQLSIFQKRNLQILEDAFVEALSGRLFSTESH